MKKFEYKVVVIPVNVTLTAKQHYKTADEIENVMNELGKEGWELVQKADSMYYFKRAIE